MHVLILVVIGLVVLAGFVLVARLIGRHAGAGAQPFVWIWLAASIANGVVGISRAPPPGSACMPPS